MAWGSVAPFEQIVEGFGGKGDRHDLDPRRAISPPTAKLNPAGVGHGLEWAAPGQPRTSEQCRHLETRVLPKGGENQALRFAETGRVDRSPGGRQLNLLCIRAEEPGRDHGRERRSQGAAIVTGDEFGDVHESLRQQGRLVEDLFNVSNGFGGDIHRDFETDDHAGGEGLSDRHPHPNTGNREPKQLIRHPVGECVRRTLGDGDVGEHGDQL